MVPHCFSAIVLRTPSTSCTGCSSLPFADFHQALCRDPETGSPMRSGPRLSVRCWGQMTCTFLKMHRLCVMPSSASKRLITRKVWSAGSPKDGIGIPGSPPQIGWERNSSARADYMWWNTHFRLPTMTSERWKPEYIICGCFAATMARMHILWVIYTYITIRLIHWTFIQLQNFSCSKWQGTRHLSPRILCLPSGF